MMRHQDGVAAGILETAGPPGRRRRRPAAPIAVLALVLAAACHSSVPAERAAVLLSVGYAAPAEAGAAAGLDQLIDQLTREGLVRSDPNGHLEPMLAAAWTVNGTGTAVSVDLRPDVTFHDGSPMTATDVKASLDRLRVDPRTIGPNPVLGDIESIEAPEPHRVVIRLARPSAQLLLFELGVRIEKLGSDGRRVATGPFFVESVDVEETTLRANPHYYQGRVEIDTVRVKTYPTIRAAWAALMRSEIDFLFDVPIEAREFVAANSDVRVFSRATPYAYALVLNTRRPPFDDQRVRVALSYGIDRDAIITRGFRGYGAVASGIWPSHWVYGGVNLTYGYDPQRADRRLSEIGFPRPAPGAAHRATAFPSRLGFAALVSLDQTRLEPTALLLQKQFRQLGVDMAIDAKPFAEIAVQIHGDAWDAVLWPLNTARNLSRSYTYWHSSQANAVSGFTGADDALEALRASVTEADTTAAARLFQEVLFAEAPAIFLTDLEETRAVSRRFAVPDAPGRDVVETLWRWRVAEEATTY